MPCFYKHSKPVGCYSPPFPMQTKEIHPLYQILLRTDQKLKLIGYFMSDPANLSSFALTEFHFFYLKHQGYIWTETGKM